MINVQGVLKRGLQRLGNCQFPFKMRNFGKVMLDLCLSVSVSVKNFFESSFLKGWSQRGIQGRPQESLKQLFQVNTANST